MARNPYRRYRVTEYQKEALKFLQPPEDITVSEWADKYRVLDAKTSAMPGPWRTEHTPYLKGIMDEFNNYETEEIVYVKPTQVGGTECLQNMVGYIVQQDPAPTMIVYPTDTLAKSISENRLQPMFKAAPELRKRFDENSQLQELQFDGMYLTLAGSNSPSSLASKAIRFLFLDEVDKYPGASKKEADPVSLARERTKTFHNRKIFITSTPTLKTGHIWKAKEDADIEKHYFVPCPHCGEYIELKWKQIHFPKEEGMSYADRAEFATYVCQECGCVITDQDKPEMLRKGEWRTVKENTKFVRKVAFWMNTLYSPFVRFSEIVKEFLDSLVKQGKEQGYVTTLYGRRRPIPEFKSSNFMQRQFGERVAMNSPIQGTAADIMKIAMIAVDRELRKRGLSSYIVLQIHDELLIETANNEVEEVKEILTDKMKHAADLRVSLEVDAKTGDSWFDAK